MKFGDKQYRVATNHSNTITTVQKDNLIYENMNASKEKILEEIRNIKPDECVRIRKFTPRECLRLMGVRDDKIDVMLNCGVSNSQLYKQAGNSIVVDTMMALFNQLLWPQDRKYKRGEQLELW